MPSLDWNRRWAVKLARFVPGASEGAHYGDRWGDPLSEPALVAVRRRFLDPFVGPGVAALEIGPGGGRWTQFLVGCAPLYLVEFNPEMFAALARRFPGRDIVPVATDGADLPGVPDRGVDFAFSYGTLVHLEAEVVGGYLRELARVLRPGGSACLHVSNTAKPAGRSKDGFAPNDPARTAALVAAAGLRLAELDDDTLSHSSLVRAVRA